MMMISISIFFLDHFPPSLLGSSVTIRVIILQVIEDLYAIWDWILIDKLHILPDDRNFYSVILVVPETFDSRGTFFWFCLALQNTHYCSIFFTNFSLAVCLETSHLSYVVELKCSLVYNHGSPLLSWNKSLHSLMF